MMYKANVAVCSEIRTKHSTQSEHHVEFLNVNPGCTEKKPLDFKWLIVKLMRGIIACNISDPLHFRTSHCYKSVSNKLVVSIEQSTN